jgi:hypothetical protein
MRIKKTSWHYRIYTWSCDLEGCVVPDQTNLCNYLWVLIRLPLTGLCIAAIGVAILFCLFFLGAAIYHHPIIALCMVAAIGLILGVAWFSTTDTSELIGEYISAKKKGVCPVVEFVEGDDNGNQ